MAEILSIDPGIRSGVCRLDWDTGRKIWGTEFMFEEMGEWLDTVTAEFFPELKVIVLERYIINGYKNNGSPGETLQIIGQVKAAGRRRGVRVVEQRPDARLIGCKWAGLTIPRGHMPDLMSAYGHGFYYLRMNNHIPTALEKK